MPNPENLGEPWKKGDPSPNPEGRPKGSKNMSTILKEMLELEIDVDGVKMTQKDAIILKLIKKSTAGELGAIQEIFDRTEGKVKQEIKHEIQRGVINIDPLADDTANEGAAKDQPA